MKERVLTVRTHEGKKLIIETVMAVLVNVYTKFKHINKNKIFTCYVKFRIFMTTIVFPDESHDVLSPPREFVLDTENSI